MSTEELLAAADKWLHPAQHKMSLYRWYCEANKLARYVQRMLDPTPVDEAWFLSVGAAWTDNRGLCLDDMKYFSFAEYDMVALIGSDDCECKTRGQVRQLCSALGIELREVE